MPASPSSFWSRVFPWLRRSNPISTTAPQTPSSPVVTNTGATVTDTAAIGSVTPSTSPEMADTPPPETTVPATSIVSIPAAPSTSEVLTTSVLPTEGVNLGFARLWQNHPAIKDGDIFPCKDTVGNANFGNQCAIMMGTCLLRSGLLHGYDKSMCWYRGHQGHTLRARELADWMRRHPERFGRVEVRKNVTWGAFKGRTGFVCFHNFWGEGNQGDHIDLWDGTGLVRRLVDASLEGAGMAHGSLDYFERAEEVWFWPIY